MPLPLPEKNESEKDFISRCISVVHDDPTFKAEGQPVAVCYSQWRKSKTKGTKTLVINGLWHLKKLADDDRIIGGYASWPVIDAEDDMITLDAWRTAWDPFIAGEYPIISVGHEDIPLGKVLPEYTDSHGVTYHSGVDGQGLYVVAKLRKDTKVADETWRQIESWGGQGAFSISAGELNEPQVRFTPEGRFYHEYGSNTIELNAISVGRVGVNPMAGFRILKAPKHRKTLHIVDEPKILVVKN